MTLQNRVTPRGDLEAVPARGAWLGNRGILHNSARQIVVPWRHKAWVTCKLVFKGRHREVFLTGRYSQLFFLDEATAFSAGHRPCAQCRYARYQEFKSAWCTANPAFAGSNPPIGLIDRQLHAERVRRGGGKVISSQCFQNLPEGTFIELEGTCWLLWQDLLFPWSHYGYGPPRSDPSPSTRVRVLTPTSLVAVFRTGFKPQVHPSVATYDSARTGDCHASSVPDTRL